MLRNGWQAESAGESAMKKWDSLSIEIQENKEKVIMNLINFIVWLSAGAVIGWLARGMIKVEHRLARKPKPADAGSSAES